MATLIDSQPLPTRPINPAGIREAHARIEKYIICTPILTCDALSEIACHPHKHRSELLSTSAGDEGELPADSEHINLFFKCENLQKKGAFKVRGAFHAISRLPRDAGKKGVVTHSSGIFPLQVILKPQPRSVRDTLSPYTSAQCTTLTLLDTGNHAAALAYAWRKFEGDGEESVAAVEHSGVAHVVMPSNSIPVKISNTKEEFATIAFSGPTSSERAAVATEVQAKTGAHFVPPYDHPDIILGQGTVGLELDEQSEEIVRSAYENNDNSYVQVSARKDEANDHSLDMVVVPLGGGGLLSGICTWFSDKRTLVFGAEPSHSGANDAEIGLKRRERITHVHTTTIADGLRTPVGVLPWNIISDPDKCAGVYSVSEEHIKVAVCLIIKHLKVVIEPSAAVGLAVVLFNKEWRKKLNEYAEELSIEKLRIGVVLTGGNVDMGMLEKILGGGRGRLV